MLGWSLEKGVGNLRKNRNYWFDFFAQRVGHKKLTVWTVQLSTSIKPGNSSGSDVGFLNTFVFLKKIRSSPKSHNFFGNLGLTKTISPSRNLDSWKPIDGYKTLHQNCFAPYVPKNVSRFLFLWASAEIVHIGWKFSGSKRWWFQTSIFWEIEHWKPIECCKDGMEPNYKIQNLSGVRYFQQFRQNN